MILKQTIRTSIAPDANTAAEVVKITANDISTDLDERVEGVVQVAATASQTVNIAHINTPAFLLVESDVAVSVQLASGITVTGVTRLVLTGTFDMLVLSAAASEATVEFIVAGKKS